jgi:hypothetical protein
MAQSIVKVPKELIKLQQDVELAIDCFFVNKHIFLTTYSTTKICFTTVTHLAHQTKSLIWEALHATYKMYLLHGFMIVVIAGDHKLPPLVTWWGGATPHCTQIRLGSSFTTLEIDQTEHQISQGEDPFSLPQSTL